MVKRLKKRFMLISVLSVFIALVVLISAMNIINYRKLIKDSDSVLDGGDNGIISVSGSLDDDEEHGVIAGYSSSIILGDAELISEKDPSASFILMLTASRTFYAHLDGDMNMLGLNSTLFGYTNEDYRTFATEAIQSGRERGFVGDFRFKVESDGDNGYFVMCYDVSESIHNYSNFLKISIGVSATGLLILSVILYFVSDKAIRPIVDSYEKQKRFITDAGHELKTPLTIIRADADALEMDIGDGNEWVSDIRKQTMRMNELTNNLILLSKMEETHLSSVMETVDLHDVVEEQSRSFKAVAESCDVEMKVDAEDTVVKGDTKMLTQLVSILMDNAVKYCPDHKSIDIKLIHDQKHAILEITNDTKEDIKEESLKHLFDRFFRTDSSHNSETGGHGIGLSIARAIVDSHKGKITAEKRKDYSITFKVLLPL